MAMRFIVAVFSLFLFLSIASRFPLSLSADIPGFIYIDCGASDDTIDIDTGLSYKLDKYFIETGENHWISQESRNGYWTQYWSLRSFPEGERNCYTVKLDDDTNKNNTYLVRAMFKYGNYDGKNQTPIFDIYLDVHRWMTVQFNDGSIEANYVPSTDNIQVCLVNIGNGIPYISTLELRRLETSIYPFQNGHFTTLWDRKDIGSSGNPRFPRYPQDVYDRSWEPLQYDAWSVISTKEVIPTIMDDPYKVPQLVLATASKPQNSTTPLTYVFTPSKSGLFYFCLHFVEIEKLEDGQFREMRIVLNNDHVIITNSIKLDYLKRETICSDGLTINLGQQNNLAISSTPNSKHPPILNALEVFYSMELTNSPTFLRDVNAMTDIKQSYRVRKNWQGDPCIPTSFIWDGLICSNSTSPRIIALNLSRSKLTGDIALSFSNLTQLESLDLSYNDLRGTIPEFFVQLPNLKILNLTGNNLIGLVPEALLQKSRDGILLLSVNENPDLCLSPPCKDKKKFTIPILAYIISGIVLFIIIVLAILMIIAIKRKQNSSTETKGKGALKPKNRPYSYSEVASITNNFKTSIGEGGFGKVYLGTLKDKTPVAVKLLSPTSKQGYKEFQAEAQLLMIVHHQNLVSLVGYCDEGDKRVLIYEYMPRGNLQQHLSEKGIKVLSWIERLQIAIDTAHGLEYLHNGCKPPIIHRDLKPANILLDEELRAKIADFGLSRAFTTENDQHLTNLAGTLGYLDPEYQIHGNLNKKSDTYSLGIILFELITGRPAITRDPHGNVHILEWVAPIINRGDTQNIVDIRLEGDYNKNSAWKMVEIAVSCTQPTADQRPDMSYVLEELKECLTVDQGASTGEYTTYFSAILAESDITPCLRAQTVQLQERNERLTPDMSTVLARLDASERALLESERERREFERSMKATVDSLMAAVQGSQGSSTSGIAAPRHEPLPDLE